MLTKRRIDHNRLSNLQRATFIAKADQYCSDDLDEVLKSLSAGEKVNEKLVSAGYLTIREQKKVTFIRNLILLSFSVLSLFLVLLNGGTLVKAILFFISFLYASSMGYFIWLKYKINKVEREVYYDTPLFLEELVLLVESGLALFSALQQICINDKSKSKKSLVRRYMSDAYRMASSGLPVSEAFEFTARNCQFKPIKNVLLHLDVSSSVGGELVHALQALASQVHQEWKMSVETRVKKLENLVVFPVFAGVMGMMLLTAAVPLVPILDFMNSIKKVSDNTNVTNENKLEKFNN
jgi:pilus assembly protein TadC